MNTELSEPLVATEGGSFNKYGIWSMLSFSWLSPLLRVGASRRLKISDIPDVPESETEEKASILLEESIRTQSDVFSLPRAIFSIVWRSLLSNAFFAGTNTITSYICPLLIIHFVEYMSKKGEVTSSYKYGLTLSLVFFVAKCLESLSQRQWLFGASRVGVRVRAATMGLVYKKSLSLKVGQRSSPPVINLMDVDTERLGDFFSHVHGIWLLPLQVCLALGILYKNLGLAPATAAFLSTVLIMIGNTPLANKQKRLQAMIMEAKDTRINATSKTIKNVRFLMFNSWEDVFVGRLLKLREKEKSWLTQYLYTCSTVAFLFWASPALVSIMTFGVCTLVNTPLGSSTILSTLATFRILQEPIYNLPELISVIAQTRVSVSRLEDFHKGEQGLHTLLRPLEDSLAIDVQIGE